MSDHDFDEFDFYSEEDDTDNDDFLQHDTELEEYLYNIEDRDFEKSNVIELFLDHST